MYKVIASQNLGLAISMHPERVESLSFPDISIFLQSPSFQVLEARLTISGENFPISYRIPNLDIPLNPHTAEVESQVWTHCQAFNLYEGRERAVNASKFSYLPGLTDPTLSLIALKSTVNGFIDLFVHDDDIDEGRTSSTRLKETNRRFVEVATGRPPTSEDLGKVRGYAQAIKDFFSSKLSSKNSKLFIETLNKYLQSTEEEAADIEENIKARKGGGTHDRVSYTEYIESRRDTSGIFHAIQMIWSAHELDAERLISTYLPLEKMYRYACDSVCRLNDIASANKECVEFQALATKLKIPVKDVVTSNSVLLKWKEGKDFSTAVNETLAEYEEIIASFMKYAWRLQDDIRTDPELKIAVNVLFGLVRGHGVWAGLSKRYDLEFTTPVLY